MIRDPSDGTQREKPKIDISGLPPLETNEKRGERLRLEASRKWLKEYHELRKNGA